MRHHAFRSSVVAFGALVLTAAPLFAQTAPEADLVPELVTDRPDFTESSFAIAKGWFQLESGLSFEGDGPDARAFTAPAALVRIGLGFNTELRLAGDGLVSQSLPAAARRASRTSRLAPRRSCSSTTAPASTGRAAGGVAADRRRRLRRRAWIPRSRSRGDATCPAASA
jgi:hypothetical protein